LKSSRQWVVRIDADGLMEPLKEGATTVVVKVGRRSGRGSRDGDRLKTPPPVSFEHEIQPILTQETAATRAGAMGRQRGRMGSSSACWVFDAPLITTRSSSKERAAAFSFAHPANSLRSQGVREVPHGGGLKIESGGPQYKRLVLGWFRRLPATNDCR